jgi:hypothetical protein
MPLPVWTQDDEENWQRMMNEAARMKRRAEVSTTQQNRGSAPEEGEQARLKGHADGRNLAAPTDGVSDSQRQGRELLFSAAADGSAQSDDRMATTGLGGAGARMSEFRPTSAFGGGSREDSQKFRLYPSADSTALEWQAAPQKPAGEVGPATRPTAKGQSTASPAARNAEGGIGLLFQNPKNYLSAPPAPEAPAPPGVNEQAWQQSIDQYRADHAISGSVPYPLHGWNFVSESDRKNLLDMMRQKPKAANEYAAKVGEQIYRDHPVEMWLPFGPNLPSKQEEVKDVDTLEHSGWWAHATAQERAGLADLLVQGKTKDANTYAKKLSQAIQARLTKQGLDPYKLPAPPPVGQDAWNESIDEYHPGRGGETTATIAGRIYGETRGMKDSPEENEPLSKAQQKMVHHRIDAIEHFAPVDVQSRASMAKPIMKGPEYQSALEATRKAVEDHLMGQDPTRSAYHFNMRTPEQFKHGGQFEGGDVHTWSGPYISPSKYKYILTYGDPETKPSTEKAKSQTQEAKKPPQKTKK